MEQSNGQEAFSNEIVHLQELNTKPRLHDAALTNETTKQAEDLIKEISVLELEVAHLEKYLLSLYRKTFERRVTPLPDMKNEDLKGYSISHSEELLRVHVHDIAPEKETCRFHSSCPILPERGVQRSRSSLSHRTDYSVSRRVYHPIKCNAPSAESYHSLPLSMLERPASSTISLGEYLDRDVDGHDSETPNWISEEMIKSISEIYCELAEPPVTNHYFPSSPASNHFSFSAFNSNFNNPFSLEGSTKLGRYSGMVEVQCISRDSKRLKNIEYMLRKYRSLVHRLRQVDPSKMKHEEKLAFWINVHNALVMHTFLVHGIPQSRLKRASVLLKAAYNVGGHAISLDMIQNYILQCKLLRPGQWLRLLSLSRQNFKFRDAWKAYAISSPESLLHFALCCGSHSDPAVRIYRPKKVFEELKSAKQEYLHSNLSVQEGKILLPRLVATYAKHSGLSSQDLLSILAHIMPDTRTNGAPQLGIRRSWKCIEWIPHNYNFRYLLSNELA